MNGASSPVKLSHRIQSLKKMAAKTGEKLNKISV